MNQFLQFLVDGEDRNNCDCLAVGAQVSLSMIYTEIVNGGPDDTNITLQVFTSAGNNIVDFSDDIADSETEYGMVPQTFTVEEPGKYTCVFTVTIDGVATTYTVEFTVCPPSTITFDSCGVYIFKNNFPSSVNLAIKTANGTIIVEDVTVLADGEYQFTLVTPGIYVVYYTFTIEVVDSDPVTITYASQVNFFCTIEACLLSLLNQVLCADAADPCCNICTAEQKEKVEMLRFELNKLSALYGYYLVLNFGIRAKYLGVFQMNAQLLEELKQLDDVITKIAEITKRCGLEKCQEDALTQLGCGC